MSAWDGIPRLGSSEDQGSVERIRQVINSFISPIRKNQIDPLAGNILNLPRVSVFRAAATTLTTGVPLVVTWDTSEYDTDGMWDGATKFTAITTGLYAFTAFGDFASSAVGFRQLYFRKNGSGASLIAQVAVSPNGACSLFSGPDIPLAQGDYIEVIVAQTSGGNLAFTAATAANRVNGFQARLVSTTT